MRVIPVLDVRHGQAVRAVAGDRAHYGPLTSVLHGGPDPVALARSGRDAWGLPDLYLADLDAITGRSDPDLTLYRALADLGLNLWIDAGVRDAGDLPALLGAGVGRVVVGLETARGPEAMAGVVAQAGSDRVAFSLDLRDGRPMVDTRPAWGTDDPLELARLAIDAGARRIIHLDLARVGTGRGVGHPVWRGPEPAGPVEWVVGGGIAGPVELRDLSRAGVWGVLVGSALHDGRIGAADLRWLEAHPGDPEPPIRLPPRSSRDRGRG
jgi:HisA/HisF family protein